MQFGHSRKRKSLLLLSSFCLKIVFALRSAAARLLALPSWLSREDEKALSFLHSISHQLASQHMAHPCASVVASGHREEGRPAQRAWELEEECGTVPLTAFPQLDMGPLQRGVYSHVAATPADNAIERHQNQSYYIFSLFISLLPGPDHVPKHVVSCSTARTRHHHPNMGASRVPLYGLLVVRTIMLIHKIKIASCQMHLYSGP